MSEWTLWDCQFAVEVLGVVVIFLGLVVALTMWRVGQLMNVAAKSSNESSNEALNPTPIGAEEGT